jgi:hypothetical protein
MTAVLKARSGWGLYVPWVFANALGEMVGLGLTFAVGIGSAQLTGESQGFGVAIGQGLLMVASGAIEGVIVGSAQWWVLQGVFPEIGRKAWVAATLVGALVAWTFGSIPATLMNMNAEPTVTTLAEPETALILLMAGLMGALLGIVLALAQWIVLRRHVRNAWWWLPANSAAWLLGMPVIFAAVDMAQNASSPGQALLIFVGALALTGAIVGAVHGIILVKLSSQEVQ